VKLKKNGVQSLLGHTVYMKSSLIAEKIFIIFSYQSKYLKKVTLSYIAYNFAS